MNLSRRMGEMGMREILYRSLLFLLLGGLTSCTNIPIKPLAQSDIPELVGKWKGVLTASRFPESSIQSTEQLTELEILSETLEGKWIIHGTSQGTVGHPFMGKIEDGKLVFSWGRDRWVKLGSIKRNSKTELKGQFQWEQWQGTLSFQKLD